VCGMPRAANRAKCAEWTSHAKVRFGPYGQIDRYEAPGRTVWTLERAQRRKRHACTVSLQHCLRSATNHSRPKRKVPAVSPASPRRNADPDHLDRISLNSGMYSVFPSHLPWVGSHCRTVALFRCSGVQKSSNSGVQALGVRSSGSDQARPGTTSQTGNWQRQLAGR
jgi:hypothetical protein